MDNIRSLRAGLKVIGDRDENRAPDKAIALLEPNKDSEIAKLNAQLAEWERIAIGYFDAIQRTLLSELSEADRASSEASLSRLSQAVHTVGFEMIRPAAGDVFVGADHQVSDSEKSQAPKGTVARCLALGYRSNSRVLRQAEVTLSA